MRCSIARDTRGFCGIAFSARGSTGSSCIGLGTASGGGTGERGLGTDGWGAKKRIATLYTISQKQQEKRC